MLTVGSVSVMTRADPTVRRADQRVCAAGCRCAAITGAWRLGEMTVGDDALMQARITIPEHVVIRRFAEESIALNLSSGDYHGLNATAAVMLEELDGGDTPAAVARSISERAGVPLETVTADLLELLRELSGRELVKVDGAG